MGYSNNTILIFGIELSTEQAKSIFEKHLEETGEFKYQEEDCVTTEVAYNSRGVDVLRKRNIPEMLADNADARADNMSYSEDGERTIIGVTVANTNWGDKIEDFIQPNEKSVLNFNKYILPILNEEDIKKEPKIFIVNQVW
jgi:hypothetical protein